MENKQLYYISQLSSYRFKSILFRLISVSIVAFLFMFIADIIVNGDLDIPILAYLKVIIIFLVISESNVLLDNIAERYLPIPSKVILRSVLHVAISIVIGLIALLHFHYQVKEVEVINQPITWLMFAFGFIFVFILVVVAISLRITAKWITAKKEVEDLKQASLLNNYNALQDQLNPHFLFNNLSVLKSMIKYDTKAAFEFTQNFTDIYRYVLQSRDKTTVQLNNELEFIQSYIGLHIERLGEGLEVEINIEETMLNKEIPPLSLQLLLENAIKHNIVSRDQPLHIRIFTYNNKIIIENKLQLKESTYSTHMGLKNLIERYTLLSNKKVKITQDEHIYKVELPLL